jgi:hypothetical protein
MSRAGVEPAAVEHQQHGGMRSRAGGRRDMHVHRSSGDLEMDGFTFEFGFFHPPCSALCNRLPAFSTIAGENANDLSMMA